MNRPSSAQRWVIFTGLTGGLALGFLVGFGLLSKWGANQWGPVAAWFAGATTLAAVVVALRQANIAQRESRDLQFARLVDHEVTRRRECIDALANLWAAITGMQMEFTTWTGNLKTMALDARPVAVVRFSWEWENRIEPPLFVALLVLRGTPLYEAVVEVNDTIDEIKSGLEPIRQATIERQQPDTAPITESHRRVRSHCF
jgi:hypothetical protein